MTKQDELIRTQKRLLDQAVEHATHNRWDEAIQDNLRLLELAREPNTLNRLGKAYLEIGDYEKATEYYRETLRINSTNVVARKMLNRLEQFQSQNVAPRQQRKYADLLLFIVDSGKTALTTLTRVASTEVIAHLAIGEQVELQHNETDVWLTDSEGQTIGYLEPHIAQRLGQMLAGGNRYVAVIANIDAQTVKVLIRETYQAPSQRERVSFPGKLGGDIANFRTFRDVTTQFDLEAEELIEEEELVEDEVSDEGEEDFFRGGGSSEEELGLEALEANISNDDEEEES